MDKPGFRLYEKTRYEGSYTGTDERSAFQYSASVEDSDWNFDLNYIVWLGQKKKSHTREVGTRATNRHCWWINIWKVATTIQQQGLVPVLQKLKARQEKLTGM